MKARDHDDVAGVPETQGSKRGARAGKPPATPPHQKRRTDRASSKKPGAPAGNGRSKDKKRGNPTPENNGGGKPRPAATMPANLTGEERGAAKAPQKLRKDDILALHRRLARVRRALEDRGQVLDPAAFTDYDLHGVNPLSIQQDASRHYRAVLLLCEGLERAHGAAPTRHTGGPRL